MSTVFSSIASFVGGGPKLIAIIGATGLQGSAVVRAFNELPDSSEFELRAITRNPESEKAKAVEPLVKEVVQADADDEESMVKAFEGCYGAYVVTDFWQDMSMSHEMQTTRTIQAAAKKADLKHVVLSTLPDTRELVNKADNKDTWKILDEENQSYVPHLDGKGEVAEEFAAEVPTTKLNTTFYMENFINYGMGPSQHAAEQPHAITFPLGDSKVAMVALKDIGRIVPAIFKDPSLIGKTVGVSSEILTMTEVAAIFEKVCGYNVVYNNVPHEVYAGFGFPGAEELACMFRAFAQFDKEFTEGVPVDWVEGMIGAPTVKLEEWVTENKDAFPENKIVPDAEKEEETAPKEGQKTTSTSRGTTTKDEAACCTIQ